MQYLNLTEGFDPFRSANSIAFERFQFPGGEQQIRLKNILPDQPVTISGRFHLSDDIIMLLLAVDALRRSGGRDIELFIPYLPYARQDRVMVPGEPLSIKVFANLINSCGFKKVIIFDPHSEVSAALIDHCQVLSNAWFIKRLLEKMPEMYICSPDAGAEKKIYGLCQDIGYTKEIIFGRKHRDVASGKLQHADVINSEIPDNILIVDDICDGGGTFSMLAEAIQLKNPDCKICLAISHGIFSKGLPVNRIAHVYTTDSFQNIADTDYITQISITI